jgi:hypothetical protein
MAKIGNIKTISYGAVFCLPFIIIYLITILGNRGQIGFFFTYGFGYFLVILFSLINGLGWGISLTA